MRPILKNQKNTRFNLTKTTSMKKTIYCCIIASFLSFFMPNVSKALEKVTIQLKWFHQFQFAGYYAAQEKGFFRKEGLNVTLRQRDPKSNYIEDVLQGKAEYGVADAGLVLSHLQGKPVVILSQIFQHSPLVLLVLKDSDIRTPYDLKGKKVMATLKGDSDAALAAMLAKTLGGIDSVKTIYNTYRNQDLIDGKIDAMSGYLTDQPSALQTFDELQKEHILHVLKLTAGKISGETGAAKILGLNRTTLQSKMKKLGIKIDRKTAEI